MHRVRRALLSVSDKTGLVDFARALAARGVALVSTGGTARALREADLPVTPVQVVTGFPEMMDGRVKTLHPAVHGGILARRDVPDDLEALEGIDAGCIDLVVVNLYPFRETIARADVTPDEAIEQIDIGGPAMVRSAAKNHAWVGVVTRPADYAEVLSGLDANDGVLPEPLRRRLAAAAFAHTAAYDATVAAWMASQVAADEGEPADAPPRVWGQPVERLATLRYGENPHQMAGLYAAAGPRVGLTSAQQLQGKELSYNNWLDADAAVALARDVGPTGVAIVKHNNPCGAARSPRSLLEAYELARACDPVSAFGGIVATSGVLDVELAQALADTFLEVIVASEVTAEARAVLGRKKNLRVLVLPAAAWPVQGRVLEPRAIHGGLLVQERDPGGVDVRRARVVTQRAPTDEEWRSLEFAWTVARHVKSNAIVFARGDRTVGVGAGQMSRVDSTRIAAIKARETDPAGLVGSGVASDAFFPFADGVLAAAEAGATALIQPGGSIRDDEVIAAADAQNLAMVFTGRRHFKH